jgi:hypothetical protein
MKAACVLLPIQEWMDAATLWSHPCNREKKRHIS